MSGVAATVARTLDRWGLLDAAFVGRGRGLWPSKGLITLAYHRVANLGDLGGLDEDMIDATVDEFDAQMAYLRRHLNPVSGEQVVAAHRGGPPLPPNAVLVTFDDGYRDNIEVAVPILRRHGISAQFFITAGHVQERRLFWWEKIKLLVDRSTRDTIEMTYPRPMTLDLRTAAGKGLATRVLNAVVKEHYGLDLDRFLDQLTSAAGVAWNRDEEFALADRALMSWAQVKELREAGMGIGSHTWSHRVLLTLAPDALDFELRASREALERHVGGEVATIAYPVGRPVAETLPVRTAVAAAGYALGFTTSAGLSDVTGPDPLDLNRFYVNRGFPAPLLHAYWLFPQLAQYVDRRGRAAWERRMAQMGHG